MPSQIELALKCSAQFDIKGTVWNGRLRALEKHCSGTEIRSLLSDATRRLMTEPPPASSWIPGAAIVELDAAIYDLRGGDILARCSRETSEVAGTTVLRTMAEGMLRLFGTSPATMFQRMGQISSTSVRGVEYDYKPTGPKSGQMTVCYRQSANLPYCVFVAVAGGMGAIFGFLHVNGVVSAPEVGTQPPRNTAQLNLRW